MKARFTLAAALLLALAAPVFAHSQSASTSALVTANMIAQASVVSFGPIDPAPHIPPRHGN